jgi:hypothetical protein
MSILGFIKDVVLLPVDIALDVTMITPIVKIMTEDDSGETPFGTEGRLKSLVKNLEDTKD